MAGADRRFELGVARARGLDEHREFLGVFDLAPPAIDRAARRQDIDACGEALFHELVRELRRAAAVGQIGDDEIGVRSLHAVSSTHSPARLPQSPLVERYANRRGNMAPRPRGASAGSCERTKAVTR